MKKLKFFIILLVFLFSLNSYYSFNVEASSAGVGVLNVGPNFAYLKIEQRPDNTFRVYLNVSDYNSWGDIYKVDLILLDKKTSEIVSSFNYKQYESEETWDKIHLFEEITDENLLRKEKCSITYSNKKATVQERCEMSILFVFNNTYFSQIKLIVTDREGDNRATAIVDHNPENLPEAVSEDKRLGNIIFIPWIDGDIMVKIPYNFPSLLAVLIGLLGAMICIKKSRRLILSKRAYEQG